MKRTLHNRKGLTLIELLVAAALSLVVMTVLSYAFQTGMDSLSHLKTAGELQDRLRTAGDKIKEDLRGQHFEDSGIPGGKLSNVRFDLNPGLFPQAGFFRIDQTANPVLERAATGVKDYTSRSVNQQLQFTVKLSGKNREKVFSAPRPVCVNGKSLDNKNDNMISNGTTNYASRWAVVTYFLVQNGSTGDGTPMFNLHRRVQILAEENGAALTAPDGNFSTFLSGGEHLVNTIQNVTDHNRRPKPTVLGDGTDVVLSNVLSFEIKANWQSSSATMTMPGAGNLDYPYDALPGGGVKTFDTTFNNTIPDIVSGNPVNPVRARINSLQIKLRIYDPKNRMTRQLTIVQDM